MKVTKRQLRRIIKEVAAGSDPKKLYERMLELSDEVGPVSQMIERMGEEVYIQLMDLLEGQIEKDSSYSGYGEFLAQARLKPFLLQPSAAYQLFFGNSRDGSPKIIRPEDIQRELKEYEDLKSQFETKDGTDQTDRVYGRKRRNVVHIPTGKVVKSSTDRKGSLGT